MFDTKHDTQLRYFLYQTQNKIHDNKLVLGKRLVCSLSMQRIDVFKCYVSYKSVKTE